MPRRKKPLQASVMGATVHFGQDEGVVSFIKQFLRASPSTGSLDDMARDRMALHIADAYHHAQVDLGLILSGKGAKPDARRLDGFCHDIAVAWRRAELKPTAWDGSEFVRFADTLAQELKLAEGRGSLVNNAKRALSWGIRCECGAHYFPDVPLLSEISAETCD